ncbi:uncharacterized protein LOC112520323 [Cynara cardunculus var. scolymus]|uniref:Uncharacterized protein n=1 Tax=Cynara cardunculus var. scolymus TaxID=59895 RepID=A0A118K000_CYNCS|nr:uncharacterized protein LOC112520323 [Cynara cardunculus var. scolymus]KVI00617.1 Protein of unknown function DUF936, plant [Cynara cardunculus var. scolymus]
MASLTPGVLSKLLQNLDNPTAKVAGDHRSPLLQVIGIVPQDDVFDFDRRNKGFYLRVSDSVHSAYVSVPEADVDLILSDKIQLGQFIHVTRLDSGSPVPVLSGVKPVPKRRPCVGDPKDLISSDSLLIRGNSRVDFSKKKKEGKIKESNTRRLSLVNAKIRDEPETRRLSLDYSSRKSWDRSPAPACKNGRSGTKLIEPSSPLCSTPVRSARKASSVKDIILKPPNLNLAPLKNKNVIVSEKLISKPIKKDLKTSFNCTPVPSHLMKVPISARTWSDSKISWDSVSPAIRELGKEVVCHRNLGFSSAVHALEETSATENIIQCMSVFAEICELAENSMNPLVEQFLNFYQKLQTSAAVVNTLIDSKSTVDKTKGHPRNSALWVQAALGTNLAKFTLFTTEENKHILHSEGNYHVVLETTSEKIQVENRLPEAKRTLKAHEPVSSRVRRAVPTTKKETPERLEWSKGNGLKETANLAEKLLSASRKWFLNYLEESLNKGFGLTKGEDSGAVVGLLGQLKRVNQWLDDLVRGDERVENLRKKLYGFLLDHVQKAAW